MQASWTIAVQTLRNAVRSKLVPALTLLLLFVTVFLPGTLKGDGTPDGLVRLTIGYTLAMVRFLLALTAIWAGCSAISGEIAERSLYMIVTKPVRPLSVWFGKWLGLSVLLSALMAGGAAVILLMLNLSLAHSGVTSEERQTLNEDVLVSRTILHPDSDASYEAEARTLYDEKRRTGEIPAQMPEAEALRGLEEALEIQANRLETGESRIWRFQCPLSLIHAPFFHLRYTLMAPGLEVLSTEGRWEALDEQGAVLETIPVTQARGIAMTLRLPADICAKNGRIILRYTNTDPEKHTVIFPPQAGPELLCRSGTFPANYLRVVLILLIQLLFWTAIGVTAGCFFSQPVAVIFTGWLVLLTNLSTYLRTLSMEYAVFSGNPDHRIWNLIVGPLYFLLHQLIRPLEGKPALNMLLSGEQVTWTLTAHELGIELILYGGLLALLGAAMLKRREIGLPVKSS